MLQLGITAKDKLTGFQGVMVAYCTYLSGCNQALLCPPVDDKGGHRESQWFDVQRLDRVGDSFIKLDNDAALGCDIPAPKY